MSTVVVTSVHRCEVLVINIKTLVAMVTKL